MNLFTLLGTYWYPIDRLLFSDVDHDDGPPGPVLPRMSVNDQVHVIAAPSGGRSSSSAEIVQKNLQPFFINGGKFSAHAHLMNMFSELF